MFHLHNPVSLPVVLTDKSFLWPYVLQIPAAIFLPFLSSVAVGHMYRTDISFFALPQDEYDEYSPAMLDTPQPQQCYGHITDTSMPAADCSAMSHDQPTTI